jgi:hypothetical protein
MRTTFILFMNPGFRLDSARRVVLCSTYVNWGAVKAGAGDF